MITIDKLKLYEKYNGLYDGYYLYEVKAGNELVEGYEWSAIEQSIQDIYLIHHQLASLDFEEKAYSKIVHMCDNGETVEELKRLAKKLTDKSA